MAEPTLPSSGATSLSGLARARDPDAAAPSECPSEDTLGRYATGQLSAAEAETIDSHLGCCTACLARLEDLARRPDPLVAALHRPLATTQKDNPALAAAVAAVLAGEARTPVSSPVGLEPDPLLNGYRIREELGRGGMGRVYRALHPRLDQEVALKVLRPGMDSAPIVARFEAERQALALMDHPHIARVLDGGVTEAGQPFFVMELVRGVIITRYCDDHRLDLRRRLELFVLVCQAVQHAHQKGIIHRDLKPSNVLVAEYDGQPAPKVIDFGVAKALGGRSATETEVGMLVGTPAYMSPEQADLTSHDIDTRSDIYALGVLLYELLTGETPFERRLREAPLLEVLRVIREEEPPAPSARLSQMRNAECGMRNVPGIPHFAFRIPQLQELDWIVLKALEKERSRRYESAAALAADVRRFLNDEPVQAGPPTKAYRLKKFVRRHRGAVLAGTLLALALLGGSIGTTVGMVRARQAETAARGAETEARLAERQASEERDQWRVLYQGARSAVNEMLKLSRTRITRARTDAGGALAQERSQDVSGLIALQRDHLQKVLGFYRLVKEKRPDQPEIRRDLAGGLMAVAADLYHIGLTQLGEEAAREAVDLLQSLAAEFPREPKYLTELTGARIALGFQLEVTGRLDEAQAVYETARAEVEARAASSPEAPGTRRHLIPILNNLGTLMHRKKLLGEAEKYFREALVLREAVVKEEPANLSQQFGLCRGYSNLAGLLAQTERAAEAEALWRRAIQLAETLVTAHPENPGAKENLAMFHSRLAGFLMQTGRPSEAEAIFRRIITFYHDLVANFPERHEYQVHLGQWHQTVAGLVRKRGERQEARQLLAQAIVHQRAALQALPANKGYWDILLGQYSALATTLVELKELEELSRMATEVSPLAATSQHGPWMAARFLASCAGQLGASSGLPSESSERLAASCADQALVHLRQAIAHGTAGAKDLHQSALFTSLRSRPDFQQLLKELPSAPAQKLTP
jgi:serine/threonine protein kinase/tetratricopeptide (TPR) repeat protein